jgi:hypothetical protein
VQIIEHQVKNSFKLMNFLLRSTIIFDELWYAIDLKLVNSGDFFVFNNSVLLY